MAKAQENITPINDPNTNLNQSHIAEPISTCNEANHYTLSIHYRGKTKTLKDKLYTSVDQIKLDAFALYGNGAFNESNAILVYKKNKKDEVLLISMSDFAEKRSDNLFIRFVNISSMIIILQT